MRTEPLRHLQCCDCPRSFTCRSRRKPARCPRCTRKYNSQRQMIWRSRQDPTVRMGVGSGGRQWGPANHQWRGGEAAWTKYRGAYRRRCLRRWHNRCLVPGCCTATDRVQAHHIDGDSQNCAESNLVPLCHAHHWQVHRTKRPSREVLVQRLLALVPQKCRIKIAEKTGNPWLFQATRGEVTGQNQSQPQRIGSDPGQPDYKLPTRPRQTATAV